MRFKHSPNSIGGFILMCHVVQAFTDFYFALKYNHTVQHLQSKAYEKRYKKRTKTSHRMCHNSIEKAKIIEYDTTHTRSIRFLVFLVAGINSIY